MFRDGDNTWGGLKDVGFRVGRYGRLTIDSSILPPASEPARQTFGVSRSAYRDLARRCDYPLHLGLTEAGMGSKGIVASTAAMQGRISALSVLGHNIDGMSIDVLGGALSTFTVIVALEPHRSSEGHDDVQLDQIDQLVI